MSAAEERLLVLWDIDGTLLQRASAEHAEALTRAMEDVHGVGGFPQVPAAGRTDGAIARDMLAGVGVHEPDWEAIARRACERYAELCPADLSGKVAPGVPEALTALAAEVRHSLVTGNVEQVARLKLGRAGLGHHFAEGQGAFGSDAEDRNLLPPLARARAGDHPRARTVVVGDTPKDIECARVDGLRVIAVATGPYGPDDLHGADLVAESADEVVATLRAWG